MPELTVQLDQILTEQGKNHTLKKLPKFIFLTKKVHLSHHSEALLECQLDNDNYKSCTGLFIPSPQLEDKSSVILTSSLNTIDDSGKVFNLAIKFSDTQITFNNKTEIALFQILNESEADGITPIDPQLISLAKLKNRDDCENKLNQLIQDFHFEKIDTPTGRPPPDYSKLFPTPETCNDFSSLTLLQRESYDQILQMQRLEKMNPPAESESDRQAF